MFGDIHTNAVEKAFFFFLGDVFKAFVTMSVQKVLAAYIEEMESLHSLTFAKLTAAWVLILVLLNRPLCCILARQAALSATQVVNQMARLAHRF